MYCEIVCFFFSLAVYRRRVCVISDHADTCIRLKDLVANLFPDYFQNTSRIFANFPIFGIAGQNRAHETTTQVPRL